MPGYIEFRFDVPFCVQVSKGSNPRQMMEKFVSEYYFRDLSDLSKANS